MSARHASDDIVLNAGRLKHAHVEKTNDPKVCQVLAKEHTVGSVRNPHIYLYSALQSRDEYTDFRICFTSAPLLTYMITEIF